MIRTQAVLKKPRIISRLLNASVTSCEPLERRQLLSGSNAVDELDFGNLGSEASHQFEPGYTAANMPLSGTGALGQTYREPFGLGDNAIDGPQAMTFNLTVDPAKQNYLTIKLWGSDVDGGTIYLANTPFAISTPVTVQHYDNGAAIDQQGGPPAFPGRFFYYTVPIAESLTLGKTTAQLTMNFISYYDFYGGTGYHYLTTGQLTRPVYSVYSTTDPDFTPDPNAPTGSAPTQTTTTLAALTTAKAQSLISSELSSIYGSGGYYSTVTARQILPKDKTAPPEVVGLDLYTNAATYNSSSPSADAWRSTIANNNAGRGYTSFPDELLSVLSSTYLTPTLSYSPSAEVSAYHSTGILANIVSAMDGASYMQGSDGGFPTQSSGWIGLTSSVRTSGLYSGTSGREPTAGENYLEGIDVATLGETIVNLLNDSVGGPGFKTYLGQSYDADLDGSQMLRANAYERMLFNSMNFFQEVNGGASSQAMFQTLALYADQVALEKLQALYPDSEYPALPAALGLYYAQQALGIAPTNLTGHNEADDYAASADGLGEPDGTYDGGYDGGYGLYFPELAPYFADLAAEDPGIGLASAAAVAAQANNTINSFDEFISAGSSVTFNSSGGITSDAQILSQEDFITSRNNDNPNYRGFNVDSNYLASDPSGPMKDADAMRSAYLETQYGIIPDTGYLNDGNASLNDIRQLASYENTVNGLVSKPATTPLPGEPGQSNFTFADVQTGSVAFMNNGERFYMNMNWRRNEDQVNYYARIHDTTGTTDRGALIMMPYDGTTVQPDGSLSGDFNSAWVVRYGDYLIVLNKSNVTDTVSLPTGTGLATDLVSGGTFAMGSTLTVAAGQAAIFYFTTAEATNLAGVSIPAAQGAAAAIQTVASVVAGFSGLEMVNNQQIQFIADAYTSSGAPLNYVPTVSWSLQSGSVGTITPDGTYFAPSTGIGTATVIAAVGGVSTSFAVTIIPFADPGRDVGSIGIAGSDSYASGIYTLGGNGAGITGTSDAFHFVSEPVSGDVSVISQVKTQSGSNVNASAGVMIRDSSSVTGTSANSSFASIGYTPANTIVFQYRASDGATVISTPVASPSTTPYLELNRSGNSVSAFYSIDGSSWMQLGSSETVTMTTLAEVGLAVTSGTTAQNSTATFANSQIVRVAAEFPKFTVTAAAAWRGGTSNTIDTTSTIVDGSAGTALSYLWWPVSWPANGPITVGGHGTTSSGVSFTVYEAGTYTFAIEAIDAYGLRIIGTATATVGQTLTSLVPSDPKQYVAANATQQLTVTGLDEFGFSMNRPTLTWSVTGGGSISSSGLFTAPSSSDVSTVTVTGGGASAMLTVASTPLTIAGSDVGSVTIAGGENYINGTYAVSGSGAGIAGSDDAFHFVSAPVSGSFSIAAELNSQTATAVAAGAGLMIHTGVGANAIFGGLIDAPVSGDGLQFEWRTAVGGAINWATVPAPIGPTWLRLIDSAGTIAAYYSTDGAIWSQIGSGQALSLGSTPLAGLAVTSGSSASSTAVFTGVTISPATGPSVITTVASAIVSGTSLALSVTGADPAGSSTLTYAWSAVGNMTTGVSFSVNNTNAAKSTTATFSAAGSYDLRVTATDALGLSAVADIIVTVNQILTSIAISPAGVVLTTGSSYPFAAVARDQFGLAMSFQPAISWSATPGSVNSYSGILTAPGTAGTVTLSASTGSIVGTLSVAVKSLGIFSNAQDVGAPALAGSTNLSAGVYTVTGSGSDIWSASDQFQFVYEKLTGNGTIQARVVSLQNTQSAGHSKAGVMLRNTLDANSAFADAVLTYSDGVEFDYRTSAGGGPNTAASVAAARGPYWVQLTRAGNLFTVLVAPDVSGSPGTWTSLSSGITLAMNQTIYVGLAVTATNTAALNTAVIDNVSLTSQAIMTTDAAPTVATAASANLTMVTGKTVNLSVLGADSDGGGESNLTYTWASTNAPAGISFSANETNAAKATTATFTQAGSYLFAVTITDQGGLSATSYVVVTVNQTATSIMIIPVSPTVSPLGTVTLTATAVDQFGNAMVIQPALSWSVSGGGTVTAGVYTAPLTGVSATVSATTGSITGSTAMTIVNQPPLAAGSAGALLSASSAISANLSIAAVDDTGQANLIYTWSAVGSPPEPVTFSTNGTNAAENAVATFNAIGTYTLQVTITDPGGLATTLLTAPITISTIEGTSGSDTIRLVRSGSNLAVYNDATSYSVPYSASMPAITVAGGAGIDNVNIDFSGGGTPAPAAGIVVNEAGGTLTVTGTTGSDSGAIGSSLIVFNGSTVTYSNVGSIMVNGNGGSDSLTQTAQPGGGAALSFGAGAGNSLNVSSGSYSFSMPSATGITSLPYAILQIGGGASVTVANALSHDNRYVLTLGALNFAGSLGHWSGSLDLGWNDLIVNEGSLTNLSNQVGTGVLFSSKANSDPTHLTQLGVIQNSSDGTTPLYGSGTMLGLFDQDASTVATDVLIKYTYYGDANLDGVVDGTDYSRIDIGYSESLTGWANGDFNYDSAVDGSDYTLIDNAFNTQYGTLAATIATPAAIAADQRAGAATTLNNRRLASVFSTTAITDAETGSGQNQFDEDDMSDSVHNRLHHLRPRHSLATGLEEA